MPQPCFDIANDLKPSTGYSASGSIPDKAQPIEKTILKTVVTREQNIPDTTHKSGIYLVKDDDLNKISVIVDKIQEMGFSIEGRDEVEKYLFTHGVLSKNIIQVCKLIKAEFKEIRDFIVKIYRDIENPAFADLFIGLKTDEETDDTTDRIGKLYSNGCLSFLKGSSGWIQIDTDF